MAVVVSDTPITITDMTTYLWVVLSNKYYIAHSSYLKELAASGALLRTAASTYHLCSE